MSVHLYNHNISYFSVPKCACTSLKMMFFEIQNGFEFRNFFANGNWYHIHRFFPSSPFAENCDAAKRNTYRFTVIRSPVERLESCFKHWVASPNGRQAMKTASAALAARGVPPAPNWDEFIEYLEIYRYVLPNIAHHTEKLSYFLGTDPSYFDAIYPTSRIGLAIDLIREKIGAIPVLKRYNETGEIEGFRGPTAASKEKINALFIEDLELFGRFLEI